EINIGNVVEVGKAVDVARLAGGRLPDARGLCEQPERRHGSPPAVFIGQIAHQFRRHINSPPAAPLTPHSTSARPELAVEAAVADGFADVPIAHLGAALQIGNGPRY